MEYAGVICVKGQQGAECIACDVATDVGSVGIRDETTAA